MPDERHGTRRSQPDAPCLNCGDTTPGNYCPTCGQRKTEVLVSVRTILADVLEDQLVLNRALPRTIGALLFRPGFLTAEYVRGRIVRYIAPFRLYLVASVLFFIVLSFFGINFIENTTVDGEVVSPEAAEAIATIRASNGMPPGVDTLSLSPDERETVREVLAGVVATAARADSATAAARAASDEMGDTTAAGDAAAADTAGAVPRRPGLQPWAQDIQLEAPWPWVERAMERKLAQVGHLPLRDAVGEITRDMLEYAPHMVFLLLPVFAFLLKLLYIRRNRYYAEHFVFALHVHAFIFVTFLIMFILPWDWINGVLFFWMMVYVWLAMKHVYRQGWFRTTVKWWVLGWTYFFAFTFGIAGLSFAALLLT